MTRILIVLSLCLLGSSPLAAGGEKTKSKLNVLLIMSDDLNNDLGCYGHKLVKSPHIDSLAKSGIRFDLAYCQYPVCNPSRSSMLTGLYPEQSGVLSNGGNFRKRHPNIVTLPQLFKNAGYFVARVGKIYHYGVPLQIGTNGKDDAKSWHKVVNPIGVDRTKLKLVHTIEKGRYGGTLSWLNIKSKDDEHTDGLGAKAAIELLEKHHPKKTGRPFFLAVGFYRPHTPYVAPSRYFDKLPQTKIHPLMEKKGDRDDIPVAALADRPKQRQLTIAQRKEIIQAYYASTMYMDAQVGRVLAALERLGLDNDTIVIFVSDHGYHLGHHGLWQKGDLFEGSCRVPMIIRQPGNRNNGQSTKAVVEMTDIYPTLTQLCGLHSPKHIKGISIVPILRDPSHAGRDAALTVSNSRAGRMHKALRGKRILGRTIRTARYRYTEWGDRKYGVELYDYENDPMEYTNLARVDGNEALLKRMRVLMQKAKKRSR